MGVKQHLGPFLANLVNDTQENKETLLTVNNSINNQLSELQEVVTKLGEVKDATLNTLGYMSVASDTFKHEYTPINKTYNSGTLYAIYSIKANIKGSIKITSTMNIVSESSRDWIFYSLYVNGVKETEVSRIDPGSKTLTATILVEPEDLIELKVNHGDTSFTRNYLFDNTKIFYDSVIKDYSQPANAFLLL